MFVSPDDQPHKDTAAAAEPGDGPAAGAAVQAAARGKYHHS